MSQPVQLVSSNDCPPLKGRVSLTKELNELLYSVVTGIGLKNDENADELDDDGE